MRLETHKWVRLAPRPVITMLTPGHLQLRRRITGPLNALKRTMDIPSSIRPHLTNSTLMILTTTMDGQSRNNTCSRQCLRLLHRQFEIMAGLTSTLGTVAPIAGAVQLQRKMRMVAVHTQDTETISPHKIPSLSKDGIEYDDRGRSLVSYLFSPDSAST